MRNAEYAQRHTERILGSPVLTEANSAVCGEAASAPSEEGAGAPKGYKGATEGEITRGCCLHRGEDEHRVKKRSFAFALAYIKCFRTYSAYLSFRHGVLILYRRAPKLTASERKIVTKETHQGCLSFLFKSPLLAKARRGRSRAVHRVCQSASRS